MLVKFKYWLIIKLLLSLEGEMDGGELDDALCIVRDSSYE